jgi:phage tail sheath protein FI
MCGDVAGLCAKVDYTHDAWWSPAGITRGAVKNIVKLSWEPTKADRDSLYKIGVNPFVTQTGSGVVLWGDKTMQTAPTAFDHINVRRLFIVLEKAISNAAKSMLFEFNDEFTRSQFVNMVEPFLREVQGRRGITDFKVVCDGSNNTGEVVDANNFVGDIYVKPSRSINYIQLNFIAARTDVNFTEIGG